MHRPATFYTLTCSNNSFQKSAVFAEKRLKGEKVYPLCHLVAEPKTNMFFQVETSHVLSIFSSASALPRCRLHLQSQQQLCGNCFLILCVKPKQLALYLDEC